MGFNQWINMKKVLLPILYSVIIIILIVGCTSSPTGKIVQEQKAPTVENVQVKEMQEPNITEKAQKEKEEPKCKEKYIMNKQGNCCLDKNKNNVCDEEEKIKVETRAGTRTFILPESGGTVKVEEG